MKKLILAAAAMALSTSAFAGPKWTYADVGYLSADSEDDDTDGYRVSGSYGFAELWHVGAAYNDFEVEGGNGTSGGSDGDFLELWAGVNPALTDSTDFVFDIGYLDGSIEQGNAEADFDGYVLRVGLRSYITDNLELHAFANSRSIDVDSFSPGGGSSDFNDIGVNAGGQYFFTENVSVGVDVIINGITGLFDDDIANFTARYSF